MGWHTETRRTREDRGARRLRVGTHGPATWSRRAKWELVLGLSGLVYVVLILALSLDSPFLSMLFIALAGYDLLINRGRY
jgi:hypothetical protein